MRRLLPAALADVTVVVLFVLIGRFSHGAGNALLGVATTLWPFAAGLVLGWVVVRAWRCPTSPVCTGVGLWAVTVTGGMALRALSGGGTAVSFIVVASVFLGVGLIGWRAVAAWPRSRRSVPTPR